MQKRVLGLSRKKRPAMNVSDNGTDNHSITCPPSSSKRQRTMKSMRGTISIVSTVDPTKGTNSDRFISEISVKDAALEIELTCPHPGLVNMSTQKHKSEQLRPVLNSIRVCHVDKGSEEQKFHLGTSNTHNELAFAHHLGLQATTGLHTKILNTKMNECGGFKQIPDSVLTPILPEVHPETSGMPYSDLAQVVPQVPLPDLCRSMLTDFWFGLADERKDQNE